MVYVGVMAHLLSLDMAEVEEAISKQFSGKAAGYRGEPGRGPRRV